VLSSFQLSLGLTESIPTGFTKFSHRRTTGFKLHIANPALISTSIIVSAFYTWFGHISLAFEARNRYNCDLMDLKIGSIVILALSAMTTNAQDTWKPAPTRLKTQWAAKVSPTNVLPD
jgi:hypothetical protein